MSNLNIFRNIGTVLATVSLFCIGTVYAQEEMGTQSIGKMEFQKNCASCHGVGGKGDGPFVEFLRQKPSDLTTIRKRNGGVYPQAKVYNWIRDPKGIRAHGTKEMPVWGQRYSEEIIEHYGPDYTGPGSSVRQRILELVFYIGNIQQ
jgi:mono/diheme cytochrome c family protein